MENVLNNESRKQTAVRKAWDKYYERFKTGIINNGWLPDHQIGQDKNGHVSVWLLSNCTRQTIVTDTGAALAWRPTVLEGIETNEGWTRIESVDDIPNAYDYYKPGLLKGEHFTEKLPQMGIQIRKLFESKQITHFKPVAKEKRPIY